MNRFLLRVCLLVLLLAGSGLFVDAQTTLSIAITSGSNPVCAGTSVTFTATASGGSCTYTYKWYKNGNEISGETQNTYTTTTLANSDKIKAEQVSTDKSCTDAVSN